MTPSIESFARFCHCQTIQLYEIWSAWKHFFIIVQVDTQMYLSVDTSQINHMYADVTKDMMSSHMVIILKSKSFTNSLMHNICLKTNAFTVYVECLVILYMSHTWNGISSYSSARSLWFVTTRYDGRAVYASVAQLTSHKDLQLVTIFQQK